MHPFRFSKFPLVPDPNKLTKRTSIWYIDITDTYFTTHAPPAMVFLHPLQYQMPTHFRLRVSCKTTEFENMSIFIATCSQVYVTRHCHITATESYHIYIEWYIVSIQSYHTQLHLSHIKSAFTNQ